MKKKLFFKLNKKSPIFTLLICVSVLILLGFVMIYSASSYAAKKDYGDAFYYVKRQVLGAVLGVCGLVALSFFNYRKLHSLRYISIGIAILLLVLVFVPGIGVENYGAKRWIKLLPGFSPQPSEVAKFAFILFSSSYMALQHERMHKVLGYCPVLILGGIICILILLEPNLSITICMALLMLCMMLFGGVPLKHFLIMLIPLLALLPLLIAIEPYRLKRFMAFLDPWANPKGEGYQLIQSLYAIGGGGLFGVGLFNSRQKLDFLPFSESDFIFSIICEELGFFGAAVVLALFFTVIICGVKIALNAKDRFGMYLALGVVSIIAVQLIINVAVVTGSIPPTGLPLPFISYGTTAEVVFMSMIGLLINIYRANNFKHSSIVCSK